RDPAAGRPAVGIRIDLCRLENGKRVHLGSMITNSDGRTDHPILPENKFRTGSYELLFHAGDYHAERNSALLSGVFLSKIPICFTMDCDDHYHVPLLLSPYGYSTYRGS
ncbi:MAG: hydroxyisourate hydrolase, partial [Rhodobacteraceae bacterium]|nr:hydroxyisourate hydrolase [Paracoccaceae bacterium]